MEAEIEWQVYDSNKTEDKVNTKKIFPMIDAKNTDCFYCSINDGYFILTIKHNNEQKALSLYVLADQYSFPELKCSNYEKLYNLYNYLLKRLSKQLNNIKTNNFINDFIDQNSDGSKNNNITILRSAVNE